jgi:hypothetical protein
MTDEQQPAPVHKGWPKGKPRGPRTRQDIIDPDLAQAREPEPLPVADVAPRKPAIAVSSRANAALMRRLQPGANPYISTSRAIPLKEPHKWQLYIANDYAEPDFFYRMIHELGWIPLEVGDLACEPEECGFRRSETGHLVRGPQGREMIFKMDKADYAILMQRKTERNNATVGNPGKTKQATANAAAQAFGPEAGDAVYKHFQGTVTDTLEPLP